MELYTPKPPNQLLCDNYKYSRVSCILGPVVENLTHAGNRESRAELSLSGAPLLEAPRGGGVGGDWRGS